MRIYTVSACALTITLKITNLIVFIIRSLRSLCIEFWTKISLQLFWREIWTKIRLKTRRFWCKILSLIQSNIIVLIDCTCGCSWFYIKRVLTVVRQILFMTLIWVWEMNSFRKILHWGHWRNRSNLKTINLLLHFIQSLQNLCIRIWSGRFMQHSF